MYGVLCFHIQHPKAVLSASTSHDLTAVSVSIFLLFPFGAGAIRGV
jgi:hypothetical protein